MILEYIKDTAEKHRTERNTLKKIKIKYQA